MDGERNVAAAFYWASNFARMVNGLGLGDAILVSVDSLHYISSVSTSVLSTE